MPYLIKIQDIYGTWHKFGNYNTIVAAENELANYGASRTGIIEQVD